MYACNECGRPLYSKCGKTWLKRQEKNIPYLYSSNAPYRDRMLKEVRQLHQDYKGRHGCNGMNRFCNTRCAIHWANRRARPCLRGETHSTAYTEALEAIDCFLAQQNLGSTETDARLHAAEAISAREEARRLQ